MVVIFTADSVNLMKLAPKIIENWCTKITLVRFVLF